MIPFLLTLSFLLHIILLMAVYFLYQQIQLLKQDKTKEVSDLFETYLHEIKTENDRLEKLSFKKMQSTQESIDEQPVSSLTKQEVITNITEDQQTTLKTEIIDDKFETSLEAKILQLYHQGLEVEEIAKNLNCGTTEVTLIINLYEKRSHKA